MRIEKDLSIPANVFTIKLWILLSLTYEKQLEKHFLKQLAGFQYVKEFSTRVVRR